MDPIQESPAPFLGGHPTVIILGVILANEKRVFSS